MSTEKLQNDEPVENEGAKPEEIKPLSTTDGQKQINELVGNMPEPVADAIEASQEKEAQIQQESKAIYDYKGRPFDPSRHATDKDGRPLLTPTGRFKTISTGKSTINIPNNQPSDQQLASADSQTVAVTIVGMFVQCGYAFVGDEWLPEKAKDFDEEKNLINVTSKYCNSIGLRDLPPGLVCATAFLAYGLRRVTRPKTKNLVQKMTEGVQIWIWKAWQFLTKKRGVNNARADLRNNGNGKNDSGVQNGKDLQSQ